MEEKKTLVLKDGTKVNITIITEECGDAYIDADVDLTQEQADEIMEQLYS